MHTVLPVTNLNKSKQGIGTRTDTIQVISIPSVKFHANTCMVVCPVRTTSWNWVSPPTLCGLQGSHSATRLAQQQLHPLNVLLASITSSPCLPSWIFSQETRKSQGKASSMKDRVSCHPLHDRVYCFQPNGEKS